MTLTDKQYAILLDLFHELHQDFLRISPEIMEAFYKRLYAK